MSGLETLTESGDDEQKNKLSLARYLLPATKSSDTR